MPWISVKNNALLECTAQACLSQIPLSAYDSVLLVDVLQYLIHSIQSTGEPSCLVYTML